MAMRFDELISITTPKMYENLTKAGFQDREAVALISDWWYFNLGRSRRTFGYDAPVAATDADCTLTFTPAFKHVPWVDGQSVVQAEYTSTEDGFNLRFDNIVRDIKGLSEELAKAFACLAELRASLSAALDDVRDELNLLNGDVHSLRGDTTPERGERVELTPGLLSPVETGVVTPGQPFDLSKLGIVNYRGPSSVIGVTRFGTQDVVILGTERGPIVLPTIDVMAPTKLAEGAKRAGALAKAVHESESVVTYFATGNAVTKESLVERFGDLEAEDGSKVRDLVAVLPDGATYTTLEALTDAVADIQAEVVRASTMAGLGLGVRTGAATGTNVGQAEGPAIELVTLDAVTTLSAAERTVLREAGIESATDLSRADVTMLTNLFQEAGVDRSAGQIAGWRATARTLQRYR